MQSGQQIGIPSLEDLQVCCEGLSTIISPRPNTVLVCSGRNSHGPSTGPHARGSLVPQRGGDNPTLRKPVGNRVVDGVLIV
jgi:hypothetical protein